jgi:hypothetical protein
MAASSRRKSTTNRMNQSIRPDDPNTPQDESSMTYGDLANAQKLMGGREKFMGAQGLSKMFFGEGSMGRLDETRSGEQKDIMGKLYGGLGGYTAPEYQGLREQMQREGDMAYQGNLQQLAKSQARGNVHGAASSAQMAQIAQGRQQSRDTQEQDLMTKNIDEQRSRLADYAKYTSGLEDSESKKQQFNLMQGAAEKAGFSGTFFGALGMKQAAENQNKMAQIYQQLASKGYWG